ncbi:hypothetical protein BGX34_008494 [Mortierella sp. NVP85]|nr:hypothetical protein BGX34_008494 [Mortierella sp. NVP85]
MSRSSSNLVGFPGQMRFNICPSVYQTGIWANNPSSVWGTSKRDDKEGWHLYQEQLIDKEQHQTVASASAMMMPNLGKRVSMPPTASARLTSPTGKGESLKEDGTKDINGKTDTGEKSNELNPNHSTASKNCKKSSVNSTNNNNRSNNDHVASFNFKTEYCSKFRRSGQCSFGERCRFVHYEHEFQPRKRPLTYKTQHCMAEKSCPFQKNHARCDFLHEGETAEMFNKQRGVPYSTVMNILKQKMERRQQRDRRLQQQQQEQEASTGKDLCNETLSETAEIQQYDSSEMSLLDLELPARLLSVLGIDISPTSTYSTSSFESCASELSTAQLPLQSSKLAMPKTLRPEVQDLFVPPDHCHGWEDPFCTEQDSRDVYRTLDMLPQTIGSGSGMVRRRYALAGHLLTYLTSKSECSTGYYKLW